MNSIFKGIFVHRYRCVSDSEILINHYSLQNFKLHLKGLYDFLEMQLLRSELSALRRLACGWSYTVMPFLMTAILNTWAGHYTTGWVNIKTCHYYCEIICKINVTVMVTPERGLCVKLWVCLYSKEKSDSSVSKHYRHSTQTEAFSPNWNSSLIALRSDNHHIYLPTNIIHKLTTLSIYIFFSLQDRIVSMTLDKEYDVAVEAIRLVTLILQWVWFIPVSLWSFFME